MDSHPFCSLIILKIFLNKNKSDLPKDNKNIPEGDIHHISTKGMDSSSLFSKKYITKVNESYIAEMLRKQRYTLWVTSQDEPLEFILLRFYIYMVTNEIKDTGTNPFPKCIQNVGLYVIISYKMYLTTDYFLYLSQPSTYSGRDIQ